ncbi:MAG: sugar phosphate isomerase/epimerase [Candidatus Omnitrophota bacterium]|nr:sugar phosphate isomerase/epimerase [Candidatus Omnitrophota bacterium]
MARFKIGCHTLTWGNYSKNHSLKDALWEIREAGYDGVECYEPLSNLGSVGFFKMEIEEEGLKLASLSSNVKVSEDEKSDLAEAKEKVSFGSHFGIPALMTTGGWASDGLKKEAKSYKALCKRLDALAQFASKFNIQIAFHNHLDTIVEDERDILNLLEFSKSIKLCVDTGHLAAAGADPVEVINKHASSVALVHLKDWDPKIKDFTELGRGVLRDRIKNILETLEKINYTNWIIVELDRTSRTPFESAKISRDFLKEAGY